MNYNIDQVVDLAVSGAEFGIINLSILNPLLHIIVRALNLEDKRVQFNGTIVESIERSSITEESDRRITISEYVDVVDDQQVIVVSSPNDDAAILEKSPLEIDITVLSSEAPVIQEVADVANYDLEKLSQRVNELEDAVRLLAESSNGPEPVCDTEIVQKEQVTWQDIELKKQEQFSKRLYEELLAQLRMELNSNRDEEPQNSSEEFINEELQTNIKQEDLDSTEVSIMEKMWVDEYKSDEDPDKLDTLDTTQICYDDEYEERFKRIENGIEELKLKLQFISENSKCECKQSQSRLDSFEKDIADLKTVQYLFEETKAKEFPQQVDLSRLDTMENDIVELKTSVQKAFEVVEPYVTPFQNLNKDVAELMSRILAVEGSLDEENVRVKQEVEPTDLTPNFEELNAQLSEQLRENFQIFFDQVERELNGLQIPTSTEIDDFKKSLQNLQKELHKAVSEVRKMLNGKVNQRDLDVMKQSFLGILETNKLECQKQNGPEGAEAAATSKWLKGLHCLSCGRAVEQCKIDEPRTKTPPLKATWPIEEKPHVRQCGGAHTVTTPEERIEKKSNFLEDFSVKSLPLAKPTYMMGSDGRYYLAAPPKCEDEDESARD